MRNNFANHLLAVALLLLPTLLLGLMFKFGGLSDERIGELMPYHQMLGVVVLAFGAWRVFWRLRSGFLDPVSIQPPWQRKAATIVHLLLLVAIVVMLLTGVIMTIFGGRELEIFGIILSPAVADIDWLSGVARWLHGTMGVAVAILISAHVVAASKHAIVDRDTTLTQITTTSFQYYESPRVNSNANWTESFDLKN